MEPKSLPWRPQEPGPPATSLGLETNSTYRGCVLSAVFSADPNTGPYSTPKSPNTRADPLSFPLPLCFPDNSFWAYQTPGLASTSCKYLLNTQAPTKPHHPGHSEPACAKMYRCLCLWSYYSYPLSSDTCLSVR